MNPKPSLPATPATIDSVAILAGSRYDTVVEGGIAAAFASIRRRGLSLPVDAFHAPGLDSTFNEQAAILRAADAIDPGLAGRAAWDAAGIAGDARAALDRRTWRAEAVAIHDEVLRERLRVAARIVRLPHVSFLVERRGATALMVGRTPGRAGLDTRVVALSEHDDLADMSIMTSADWSAVWEAGIGIEAMRSRAGTRQVLGGWGVVRPRDDHVPQDRPFRLLETTRFAAIRSFLAGPGSVVREQLGGLGALWRVPDPATIAALGDAVATMAHPGRARQGFEAAPALADLVVERSDPDSRTRSHDCERGGLDPQHCAPRPYAEAMDAVLARLDGGDSVDAIVRDVVAAAIEAEPSAVTARTMRGWTDRERFVEPAYRRFAEVADAVEAAHAGRPRAATLSGEDAVALCAFMHGVQDDATGGLPPLRQIIAGRRMPMWLGPDAPAVAACAFHDGAALALSGDERDYLRWIAERLRSIGLEEGSRTFPLFVESVFPKGRRRPTLIAQAARWHSRVGAIEAAIATAEMEALHGLLDPRDVAALFPRMPALPEGPVATRQLVGDADFLEEGRAMSHCVATYRRDAAAGRILVFALTSAEGRSTAEIALRRLHGDLISARVAQVVSRGNAAAPASHHVQAAAIATRIDVEVHGRDGGWTGFLAALRVAAQADARMEAVKRKEAGRIAAMLADIHWEAVRPFLSQRLRSGTRLEAVAEAKATRDGRRERSRKVGTG